MNTLVDCERRICCAGIRATLMVTAVWFFSRMCAHVYFQVGLLSACVVTEVTRERLFYRMNEAMRIQTRLAIRCKQTPFKITCVWPRPCAIVAPHVPVKFRFTMTSIVTPLNFTAEWFYSNVNAFVLE
jgi:hypothetical protein